MGRKRDNKHICRCELAQPILQSGSIDDQCGNNGSEKGCFENKDDGFLYKKRNTNGNGCRLWYTAVRPLFARYLDLM